MSNQDYNEGVGIGLSVRWIVVYVVTAFCLLILTTYTSTVPILAMGFYVAAGLFALICMGLRR